MKQRTKTLLPSVILLLFLSLGWEYRDAEPVRFGKIYLFDQTLYVSELTRGVRQVDIANPGLPADLGLVSVEGNHDNALIETGNGQRILYADSHADLVVLDVTNPAQPQALDTLRNIFGYSYAMGWGNEILFTRQTFTPSIHRVGGSSGCHGCDESMVIADPGVSTTTWTGGGDGVRIQAATSGRGGSMARFAIADGYLYCVDYDQLYVFEIDDPAKPRFVSRTNIGWGIETIFPYEQYLFIGGQNGMFIYSRSDPGNPQHVSTFQHVRSCDPVVVEDTLAYVTLRGGTRCGTVVSALHIVTVADLFNPKLLKTYPLPQPMGLDVRNKVAYVCDDSTGVFILDTTDPSKIRELARITDKPGYDTILNDNVLIVVSESAVSFYNVSRPDMPFLMGRFDVPA